VPSGEIFLLRLNRDFRYFAKINRDHSRDVRDRELEQPARPHEFDTQNAKAEQDHEPSRPWCHKHHHTEECDCKADDRHCQTRCLLHCLALLGETIRSNSAASRAVHLSKKETPSATRGVVPPILGRANCHTRMADRYTVLCPCYRKDAGPEMTATTRRLSLRQSQSTSSGSAIPTDGPL